MSKNKYDLIIVGTGFASSFFLQKYLQKAGPHKRILVLERGRLYAHKDRIQAVRGTPAAYAGELELSDSTYTTNNPAKPWMFDVNFGGSSNCWWACTPRFMPNDFQLKSLYGRGQDWPLSYAELEPYYCEAEEIMGIAGPDQTPFPRSRQYPYPAHKLNKIDTTMQNAFGATQWISQPTGRPPVPIGRRSMCCSSYTCNLCPVDSKFSIENSLQHLYEDPRVELKYGLQVYGIEFENSVAKKVMAAPTNADPASMKSQEFEGEVIVLGANPIFNAHILLNSGDAHPLTGRGIGEQKGIFADIHLRELDNVGGNSSITANGYMMYDGPFRKEYASCLIENHNRPTLLRTERGKWRKIIKLKFVFEALPNHQNRVKAGKNLLKPVIEYSEPTDGYVEKGKEALREQLQRLVMPLDPEDISLDSDYVTTECHILSSVRMGKSSQDSVVDKSMIHHQYRNLFVLGGSAFPSMAAANPTLTISALSLMSADSNF